MNYRLRALRHRVHLPLAWRPPPTCAGCARNASDPTATTSRSSTSSTTPTGPRCPGHRHPHGHPVVPAAPSTGHRRPLRSRPGRSCTRTPAPLRRKASVTSSARSPPEARDRHRRLRLHHRGRPPADRSTLVAGTAGSAKTVFACQFLAAGRREVRRTGRVRHLRGERRRHPQQRPVAGLGRRGVGSRRASGRFVDASPQPDEENQVVGRFDFGALLARIERAVTSIGATRVALDSIGAVFTRFPDPADHPRRAVPARACAQGRWASPRDHGRAHRGLRRRSRATASRSSSPTTS